MPESALSAWGALLLATPRIAGFVILIPFLRPPQVPPMIRNTLIFALALVVAPRVHIQVQAAEAVHPLMILALKEAVLGLFIGFILGFLFHIPQAIGDFVDNQRGASIASLFNPALGEQSSSLGLFLSQAFLVWFLTVGGFTAFLQILLSSYEIYPPEALLPELNRHNVGVLLTALQDYLTLFLLLAAPIIFTMLTAEIALGLVSRFAPQLNVFFLAMPMKSVIALIILFLYMGILLKYIWEMQPFLDHAQNFIQLSISPPDRHE